MPIFKFSTSTLNNFTSQHKNNFYIASLKSFQLILQFSQIRIVHIIELKIRKFDVEEESLGSCVKREQEFCISMGKALEKVLILMYPYLI